MTSTKTLKKRDKPATPIIYNHILVIAYTRHSHNKSTSKNTTHETLEGSKHLAIKEGYQ
jgi:hypothetical protein